ncbi:hypothetical protein MIND_01339100 [Mycena indigotica]|uniref:F-box domain-containing protein n=1 Tax=Mycena indigotica TaxID=2126181 RepID=A0A8H6RZN5_9AGAR|nr:uncharacterized protein MIND_01339100 [Mycena indigotica]KAF7290254.1 hypothetical protein MIND_01339100 [Mycena indigotica]
MSATFFTDDVPDELWLEIASSLPRAHLQTLHQLDKRLSRLTRPLLFADLAFSRTFCSSPTPPILPARPAFDSGQKRLDFWLSDDIAPLVESCHLTVRVLSEDELATQMPVGADCVLPTATDLRILSRRLVENLSHFVRLRRVQVDDETLSMAAIIGIHGLPLLEQLDLTGCKIEDGAISLALAVTRAPLSFVQLSAFQSFAPEKERFWSAFFNADSLRAVTLNIDLAFWLQDPQTAPIFRRTTKLTLLYLAAAPAASLPRVLAKSFPALQDLGLFPAALAPRTRDEPDQWGGDPHDSLCPIIRTALLPIAGQLVRLRGYYSILHHFSTDPWRVSHLGLSPHLFRALADLIEDLDPCATLTHLSLSIFDVDTESLNATLRLYPRLEALYLHGLNLPMRMSIWTELASDLTLPPTLRSLLVNTKRWRANGHMPGDVTQAVAPANDADASALLHAFVERYPQLARLWIRGRDFFIMRSGAEQGADARVVAVGDDVDAVSNKYIDLWNRRAEFI